MARALEHHVHGIELDVHTTADGVVVVHHDPVPRARARRPALAGRPIATLTFEELQTFELDESALPERIPTLEAVLELVGRRATVYVEAKGDAVEEAVAAVVQRSGLACPIHSFDHRMIERVAEVAPELPRGILFDAPPNDVVASMRRTGARDVWPHFTLVTEALVDLVHSEGGRVIVWTVNDPREAERLHRLGVDGLCGDDPRLLP